MTTPHASHSAAVRTVAFWLLQLCLIVSGLGWTVTRFRTLQADRVPPMPRNEPIRIGSLYDDPNVVSDEQLARALEKLKPRFRGARPKINFIDHALRFWGAEATFDDPECLSGVELREMLLDHRRFRGAWGTEAPALLVADAAGVAVRTREGDATASHVDHTLASLAEAGTPLDYPVITPQGEMRLQAVLERSLAQFSLNQHEYEWSALAYALYLPDAKRWYSTEGQEITFDRLAQRIMRQRFAQGVCSGNHRLHTLIMFLRVDDQVQILSPGMRQRVIEHLQDATARFVASQHAEGFWESDWPGNEIDGSAASSDAPPDRLAERILVTGHILESWALAPPEIQPSREVAIRAGQWLTATIDSLTPAQVQAYYTYLSHAGHALALWRGKTPAAAFRLAVQER